MCSQKLNPGDGVRITFLNITDEISGDYNIQQDGNIQLPFIGLVQTTNIDYKEIKKTIYKKYSELYKDPALTIQPLLKINILGEVRTPGYYYVTDIENMTGILALAGGVTGAAASGDIYIIRGNEEILLDAYELMEANKTADDIGLTIRRQDICSKKFLGRCQPIWYYTFWFSGINNSFGSSARKLSR